MSETTFTVYGRATGVAWANGVGRSGSIAGSLLGGVLLGFGWPATTVYALVAIPAVISAVAFGTLGVMRRRELVARPQGA